MTTNSSQVLVIGAGAAGLAAADHLARVGISVTVLEARDRIGGRIRTLHEAHWPLPIEAGAEFIHGDARETQVAVDALGLSTDKVPDRHWQLRRDGVVPVDLEPAWRTVSQSLASIGSDDLSFAELLRP